MKIKINEILETELKDPKMKRLYDLTGKAKREKIEKETEFSAGKISGIWMIWERKGILRKVGKSYKKICE